MRIRTYRPSDARAVERLHRSRPLEERASGRHQTTRLHGIISAGGRAWVLEREGVLIGYASVEPVAGLPGVLDLQGFITPVWRRQGLGSRLLEHVLEALGENERQLSHAVASLKSPAAFFLLKHGFYVEHVERQYELDDLSDLPSGTLPAGFSLRTLPKQSAARLFRRLYEASFKAQAWYQPFGGEEEIAAELSDPKDILFLFHEGSPVGFVWSHRAGSGQAEIEPLGLLPAYQGQGLARALLLAEVRRLADQGVGRVRLGVWADNEAAIGLYESVGFRCTGHLSYLAFDRNVKRR